MRYLKSICLVLVVPFIMGSGTREMKFSEGLNAGDLAPEINLEGVSLKSGSYVLLQFWAAYDAESRLENVRMHNKISSVKSGMLRMVSISFDEKKSVFEGTILADKLNRSTQFNENSGIASDVYKNYHLQKGFGNLLIDPLGVIIGKNLKPEELENIFRK